MQYSCFDENTAPNTVPSLKSILTNSSKKMNTATGTRTPCRTPLSSLDANSKSNRSSNKSKPNENANDLKKKIVFGCSIEKPRNEKKERITITESVVTLCSKAVKEADVGVAIAVDQEKKATKEGIESNNIFRVSCDHHGKATDFWNKERTSMLKLRRATPIHETNDVETEALSSSTQENAKVMQLFANNLLKFPLDEYCSSSKSCSSKTMKMEKISISSSTNEAQDTNVINQGAEAIIATKMEAQAKNVASVTAMNDIFRPSPFLCTTSTCTSTDEIDFWSEEMTSMLTLRLAQPVHDESESECEFESDLKFDHIHNGLVGAKTVHLYEEDRF